MGIQARADRLWGHELVAGHSSSSSISHPKLVQSISFSLSTSGKRWGFEQLSTKYRGAAEPAIG
jgi:hypothetical protein